MGEERKRVDRKGKGKMERRMKEMENRMRRLE